MNHCPQAEWFVMDAIQDWGQPPATRVAAVQAVLDAAGFCAVAKCGPIFGGIWLHACEGADGEAATAWLVKITETMPRGHYEDEVAHVEAAVAARKTEA